MKLTTKKPVPEIRLYLSEYTSGKVGLIADYGDKAPQTLIVFSVEDRTGFAAPILTAATKKLRDGFPVLMDVHNCMIVETE